MALQGEQEGKTAAVHSLEEGALAESHDALTCFREVLDELFLGSGGFFCLGFIQISGKPIAWQQEFFHHRYHFF